MSENTGHANGQEEQVVQTGVHNFSKEEEYVKPADAYLLERLEWFKDQKLGLMMHWGPYSQLGIVESWALSDDDADWSREGIDWERDGEAFKRQYFDLNRTFNPIRFQPDVWADLAADNGFKYLLFTTKHHDGFCMWDTATTDYRVTSPDCPFHAHPNADICKALFEAFRNRGLAVSAYFSKADWHTPHYWAPGTARGNRTWRGPSYDPAERPKLWERFVDFTHRQLTELLTDYGRIDVLWLDAGWVRDGGRVPQDIRLGELVERARERQPWLLSADRTVGGPYENIVTPEQTIPDGPMNIPWESCITLGTSFSFKYEDRYKSAQQLVGLLLEVVAKGGNLALNVGPQPDGRLPEGAIKGIRELGAWLNVYGEGVYGTRICAPYYTGDWAFTRKADTVYAFRIYRDPQATPARELTIPYLEEVRRIEVMGGGEALAFARTSEGYRVRLPEPDQDAETPIAIGFRIATI
ncbi:alpha-L-fucosidase [Paenibacillus lycopersici]|uniref:alpha-L-fucosidase n=1 Tax=Paenibacillus lycopersici TaxID=2704462 RepID=A0A6C0FXC9_9BACL|nr:alpha-L-fucosidase [Paenibacillus lycopersici]QHT58860.1 alpha-L-fucosidase [Paenibacillus lycopersici]